MHEQPLNRDVPTLLHYRALHQPSAPALTAPERTSASYAELWAWIDHNAQAVLQPAVARGARIAVAAENGPEMASAILLASCHGVAVPLSPATTEHEAAKRLVELGVAAVMLDPAAAPGLERAAARTGVTRVHLDRARNAPAGLARLECVQAGDPRLRPDPRDDLRAILVCTAATTGRAKTIPYTHAELLTWGSSVADHLSLDESGRCLNVMPFFHSHGLFVSLFGSLCAGGSVICTRGLYLPNEWHRWNEQLQPTWFTAVPSVLEVVLSSLRKHGCPKHSLRFVRTGSAAIRVDVLAALQQTLGVPVVNTYGMTEVLGWLACMPVDMAVSKRGSVGRRTAGVTVLSAAGVELAPGAIGEIAVARARWLRALEASEPDRGPWMRSGDLGLIDSDGFLFLTGRTSEVIQRSGEKLAPAEIDRVFQNHPDVAHAVAFPLRSRVHGQEVGIAIVPREGSMLDRESLQALAVAQLQPAMVPRQIFIVPELPRTEAGKISRRCLAEWLDPNTDAARST
jgi:oxalate---CoA ligase